MGSLLLLEGANALPGLPVFPDEVTLEGARLTALASVFTALAAACAALGEAARASLCAVFTTALLDCFTDFNAGLAVLFRAEVGVFCALFLLAIAYSTQIHRSGNI